MATAVVMPKQGNTVETCLITKWYKKKGESVRVGEPLFNYETDKASFDFESPASGILLDIFCADQQDIPVLATIGAIGEAGEDISALKSTAAAPVSAPVIENLPASKATPSSATSSSREFSSELPNHQLIGDGTAAISPRAKGAAARKGIDPSLLSGTGPGGRVIERDVMALAAKEPLLTKAAAARLLQGGVSAPSSGTGIGGRVRATDLVAGGTASASAEGGIQDRFTEVKLSKIRHLIASRMMDSLHNTAQLTMNTSADASAILAYRALVKKQAADNGVHGITITDMILFAVTRVLPAFPEVNATFDKGILRQFATVHLALAVDTPRGLMVPVTRFANLLSLVDLSANAKVLARQCQDGSINPDLLSGGTLTVTNLGSFGIESFTPVLNLPQVAILGVNTITNRAVVDEEGKAKAVPYIGLSLTIDHRVLDGAPGARFLKALVHAIENFNLTLAQ